jgi:zinc transport system substrate-binding protein
MLFMKKISVILAFIMLFLCVVTVCACTQTGNEDGISIVCTSFAPYDLAREIAGDGVSIKMLLSPGADSHSYDPTPKDILAVNKCDVFIYVGGESDVWVEAIVSSVDNPDMKIVRLIDCTGELYHEEHKEVMELDHGTEDEYDEHVWTNPRNAAIICEKIAEALCAVDTENTDKYNENLSAYKAELTSLDEAFKKIVAEGNGKPLVFGDRFPLIYFVKAYGLDYYAAFPGCASDTEPSGATVAFLINKVKEENIPVVFHIELSTGKIADTICEATGAAKMQFNACHNVTKADLEAGVSYLDLMWDNVEALKAALK